MSIMIYIQNSNWSPKKKKNIMNSILISNIKNLNILINLIY